MIIPSVTALPPFPNRLTFTDNEAYTAALVAYFTAESALSDDLNAFAPALVAASAAANASATSTTELTIVDTGTISLTIADGKMFVPSQWVTVGVTAEPEKFMFGQLVSYNFANGEMVVDVEYGQGSGTYTAWSVGLSGPRGLTSETSILPSFVGHANEALIVSNDETTREWVDLGAWETITTVNPSVASQVDFSGLGATPYNDIRVFGAFTLSSAGFLRISLGGTTAEIPYTNIGASGTLHSFSVTIPGFRSQSGNFLAASTPNTGAYSLSQAANFGWIGLTNGATFIRFLAGSGGHTITGTATLLGRRA